MRILVLEHDKQLASGLRRGLEAQGGAVHVARTGTDGEWYANESTYDAVALRTGFSPKVQAIASVSPPGPTAGSQTPPGGVCTTTGDLSPERTLCRSSRSVVPTFGHTVRNLCSMPGMRTSLLR